MRAAGALHQEGRKMDREHIRKVTPEWVVEQVKEVYASVGDYEAAHSLEDKLHQKVLEAIANGRCDDPQACASIALRTQGFDFPRYCA
jgi:hypothetical protein